MIYSFVCNQQDSKLLGWVTAEIKIKTRLWAAFSGRAAGGVGFFGANIPIWKVLVVVLIFSIRKTVPYSYPKMLYWCNTSNKRQICNCAYISNRHSHFWIHTGIGWAKWLPRNAVLFLDGCFPTLSSCLLCRTAGWCILWYVQYKFSVRGKYCSW